MSKDRYERRHRRTWRHPAAIEFMAKADFDAVPSLAEAMGLEGPAPSVGQEGGPMPLTCTHAERGLCAQCQVEFDEDPMAYLEYGSHPDGEARWKALLEEMAQRPERPEPPGYDDSHIPF